MTTPTMRSKEKVAVRFWQADSWLRTESSETSEEESEAMERTCGWDEASTR